MKYKIITGANNLYILTLITFITHHLSIGVNINDIIIYDLGIDNVNLEKIAQLFNNSVNLKKLNYSDYPEHVDLNKYYGLNCTYAFKPIIIYNEANEEYNKDTILIWMDSANICTLNDIYNIVNITTSQGIYSPISANKNTIESIELNNHQTVKYYGLTDYEHTNLLESISANLVSINYNSPSGSTILNKWYNDSLNKDIIAPNNTNRNNHRQDQSVLSIIMYLYQKENNIIFYSHNVGVQFWIKKDRPILQEGYYPFKLLRNGIQIAIIYCKTIEEAIFIYADRKKMEIQEFLQNYNVTRV
jgi:hypothetical protein